MTETLPTNPAILLSAVNTMLRDGEFDSLGDLARYYERIFAEETHVVAPSETAAQVGSGLLPVYATPQVAALMEHTACTLIAQLATDTEGHLNPDETTVGTHIAIDHIKASPVGATVHSTAMLVAINGRQYDFLIEVRSDCGILLAKAEHTRFRVQSERFMDKLQ